MQFTNTSSVHCALQLRQMLRKWTRENTSKLIEDLHLLPCLWISKQQSTRTVTRKVLHMTLWLKTMVLVQWR